MWNFRTRRGTSSRVFGLTTSGKPCGTWCINFLQRNNSRSYFWDVLGNLRYYCIGNHAKCLPRFCEKSETEEELASATEFVSRLKPHYLESTRHATSIQEYETKNSCELTTKFSSSKRLFNGRRNSYIWRTFGAGQIYQNGQMCGAKLDRKSVV